MGNLGAKTYVYVLQLQDGCYYIGKTANYEHRIKQHFRRKGAEWTKRHSQIRVLVKIEINDEIETDEVEKLITMFFAHEYGREFVRGAGWSAYCDKPSIKNIFTEANLQLLKRCKIENYS